MHGVRPQDAGQLGDVGFLHPAPVVRALSAGASIPGAALADLTQGVDGVYRSKMSRHRLTCGFEERFTRPSGTR